MKDRALDWLVAVLVALVHVPVADAPRVVLLWSFKRHSCADAPERFWGFAGNAHVASLSLPSRQVLFTLVAPQRVKGWVSCRAAATTSQSLLPAPCTHSFCHDSGAGGGAVSPSAVFHFDAAAPTLAAEKNAGCGADPGTAFGEPVPAGSEPLQMQTVDSGTALDGATLAPAEAGVHCAAFGAIALAPACGKGRW